MPKSSTEPQQMRFGSLTIAHDQRVLTPRDWTQHQSRWAAELLAGTPDARLLELCTGAGHIGLLALAESPAPAVLVDIDPVACGYAELNARQLASPIEVRCGPMSDVVGADESFSVVVADPPWVASADIGRFPEDPPPAINGGPDGLDLARECLRVIDTCLTPTGTAILQLGNSDQVAAISTWLADGDLDLVVVESRSHAPRGVLVAIRRSEADEKVPG